MSQRLTTNSPIGKNPDQCLDEKMHSDFHPSFAPDGKHILFVSDRDGNNEIYIMDLDGKNQKRLTFNKVDDDFPQWRTVKKPK